MHVGLLWPALEEWKEKKTGTCCMVVKCHTHMFHAPYKNLRYNKSSGLKSLDGSQNHSQKMRCYPDPSHLSINWKKNCWKKEKQKKAILVEGLTARSSLVGRWWKEVNSSIEVKRSKVHTKVHNNFTPQFWGLQNSDERQIRDSVPITCGHSS